MLVLLLSLPASLLAQPAPRTNLRALDALFAEHVRSKKLPGLSVGIIESGRLVFAKGYGKRSLQDDLPVKTDTRFAIGSVTKQFTCACALMLCELGKLSVYDPVAKFYPDLKRAKDIQTLERRGSLLLVDEIHRWNKAQQDALLPHVEEGTVVLVGAETLWVPEIRDAFLSSSLGARIAVTALLQLPMGLCLGMYFPTGIELLRRHQPRLVPWAWALNGVGSVVSSVLAVVLAMAIGFSGVALVSLLVYAIGILSLVAVLPRLER